MTQDLTVDQLRAFLRVADGAGYAGVGGGSKQAGYQKLRRLEAALMGADATTRLVATGGRGLTADGRLLLNDIRDLIGSVDRLRSRAAEISGSQSIAIACLPAHIQLVQRAASAWEARERSRDLRLYDVSDRHRADLGRELSGMIRAGLIDIAVVPEESGETEVVWSRHLYSWPIRCVLPEEHELSKEDAIEIADLSKRNERIMGSPPTHLSRLLLDRTEIRLDFWFESESVDALVELAVGGKGVALVAGDAIPVQGILRSRHLPVVTFRGQPIKGSYAVMTSESRERPHVSEFVTDLLAVRSSLMGLT